MRWLGRIAGVAVLAGVPAGFWYLGAAGLDAGWRERLAEAAGGERFRIEVGKLTFRVFEGLVAENVRVADRAAPAKRLAEINRVEVALDFAALIQGRVQVDALQLENASLAVPFADDGVDPDAVWLTGVNARVYGEGGHLRIREASLVVEGIALRARGVIENSGVARVEPPDEERAARRAEAIRLALREIRALGIRDDARPEIDIVFRADAAAEDSPLRWAEVSLRGGPLAVRGLEVDSVRARGEYSGGVLSVPRAEISGPSLDLRIGGWWSIGGGGEVELIGRATPAEIAEVFAPGRFPEELRVAEAAEIEATVELSPEADGGTGWRASGTFGTGAFEIKGVRGKRFSAAFAAAAGGRIFLKGAKAEFQTGEVRGDFLSDRSGVRLRLESGVIPTELASVFGPKEREILDAMEFRDAPAVRVELSGERLDFYALSGTGEIELGRTAMRGSWVDRADAELVFGDGAVRYKNLTVAKGDGVGTGGFVYDFGRREVRLEKVRSTLNPVDILMWVDPRIARTVEPYRFRANPTVLADGVVGMADPAKNSLVVDVDAAGGLEYELLGKDLTFGRTRAEVRLVGQEVKADVSRAELFGGAVGVLATISTDPENPVFGAEIDLRDIDFPSLTKRYFGYEKSEGSLDGRYSFRARLDDPGGMTGRGTVRVSDGHVLSIPIFGPLSEVISLVLPGAGHDPARLATADFEVGSGEVSAGNLEIEGNGFTLYLDGSVAYPSGRMDMNARINARGITGVVFFPVSKLFEYTSTGTMGDPQWRPKIIPREFFKVLGDPASLLPQTGAPPGGRAPSSTGGPRGPRGRR